MSDTQTELEPQTEELDEATEAEQQPEGAAETEAAAEGEQPEQADDDPADDDGATEAQASAEDDDAPVFVSIGETAALADIDMTPPKGVPLVTHLRNMVREKDKLVNDMKRMQDAAMQPAQTELPELPPEPTLESVNFDEERYRVEYRQWVKLEADHAAAKERIKAEHEENARKWQEKHAAYATAKKQLPVQDFTAAENIARSMLTVAQQSVLMHVAKNPAAVVYAIARHPRGKEVAAIRDPLEFAAELGRMEKEGINVQKRTAAAPPPPERALRGNAPGASAAIDSALERARAEAERTGDYTKVRQIRDQLNAKQK